MEIGTVFSGKLNGSGNFHFPLTKLLGKCPFPKNLKHEEHGEVSPFFAVKVIVKHKPLFT